MGTNVRQNIVTNGLVLYLDAGSRQSYVSGSTTWRDLSGNIYSGSLINGPTFNSSDQGSIVFDGVNDYVNLGTFTGLGSSNRTFDIWYQIKALSLSGYNRVFTFAADDTSNDTPAITIGYQTTTTSMQIAQGGPPYDGGIGLPAFSLSTWMNVIGSISGNTLSAYQNGILIGTKTNTGAVGSNPVGYIGRYNNSYGQYSNIQVASLKVYNRALSAQEVAQNYNATKTRFGLS